MVFWPNWTAAFAVRGTLARSLSFLISSGRSGLLVLQTNRAGDGVMYGSGKHQ
jgi:hypothetical protein